MSEQNPYSPPASEGNGKAKVMSSGSSKALGVLCIIISFAIIFQGLFQLLKSLLIFIATLNNPFPTSTVHAIGGVFGAAIVVILGGWLFKFGSSKLKSTN